MRQSRAIVILNLVARTRLSTAVIFQSNGVVYTFMGMLLGSVHFVHKICFLSSDHVDETRFMKNIVVVILIYDYFKSKACSPSVMF